MAVSEIKSEITGSLWKVLKAPGETVQEEEPIMILESMKMEIPVLATESGTVSKVLFKEGDPISEGDVVALIET